MDDKIKNIADKFLEQEKVPVNTVLQMGALGLAKNVGDIADLTYGINFNQYAFNNERKAMLADNLGYILLNWYLLARMTGFNVDEITNRFAATWAAHHNDKVSIKDLLKHMKPAAKQEAAAQEKQIDREMGKFSFTRHL